MDRKKFEAIVEFMMTARKHRQEGGAWRSWEIAPEGARDLCTSIGCPMNQLNDLALFRWRPGMIDTLLRFGLAHGLVPAPVIKL